jgi:hypothetical protein
MTRPVPPYPLYVRRQFFDQYARGEKTIEYRRHREPFTERSFYSGRPVSIRWRFDQMTPRLKARVVRFEVARLDALDVDRRRGLRAIYPELAADAEIALIHLELLPAS